jgi:hypothetical protein
VQVDEPILRMSGRYRRDHQTGAQQDFVHIWDSDTRVGLTA